MYIIYMRIKNTQENLRKRNSRLKNTVIFSFTNNWSLSTHLKVLFKKTTFNVHI